MATKTLRKSTSARKVVYKTSTRYDHLTPAQVKRAVAAVVSRKSK